MNKKSSYDSSFRDLSRKLLNDDDDSGIEKAMTSDVKKSVSSLCDSLKRENIFNEDEDSILFAMGRKVSFSWISSLSMGTLLPMTDVDALVLFEHGFEYDSDFFIKGKLRFKKKKVVKKLNDFLVEYCNNPVNRAKKTKNGIEILSDTSFQVDVLLGIKLENGSIMLLCNDDFLLENQNNSLLSHVDKFAQKKSVYPFYYDVMILFKYLVKEHKKKESTNLSSYMIESSMLKLTNDDTSAEENDDFFQVFKKLTRMIQREHSESFSELDRKFLDEFCEISDFDLLTKLKESVARSDLGRLFKNIDPILSNVRELEDILEKSNVDGLFQRNLFKELVNEMSLVLGVQRNTEKGEKKTEFVMRNYESIKHNGNFLKKMKL